MKKCLLLILPAFMLASCSIKNDSSFARVNEEEYIALSEFDDTDTYHIPKSYMYASDSFIASAMNDDLVYKNTYYVSATGHASGSGSLDDPISASEAFSSLKNDTKLIFLPGTYYLDEIYLDNLSNIAIYGMGEVSFTTKRSAKEINLIECASISNMVIDGINFKDITADNATGIVFYDSNNHDIVIRNNTFTNINTTKVTSETGANAVLVNGEGKGYRNFMIYNNNISNMKLGYSEAISIAGNVSYVYVVNNVLSNLTNIGIDFNGNTGVYPDKYLDQPRYCVATLNEVYGCVSPYAECAGIYVDGARDTYVAYNSIQESQYGIEIGAEERGRYPTRRVVVERNIMSLNTSVDIRCGGYEAGISGVVCDSAIRYNKLNSKNITGLIISETNGITINDNEFQSSRPIDVEFSNKYVKNIKIYDNIYPSESLFKYLDDYFIYEEFLKKI